ncbi:MAG TPA: GWxTD domain-containing protein [bacterium]
MICLLFLLAVQYQNVTIPLSDSTSELGIYLSISPDELKNVFRDSVFSGRYEIQLQVYDKKNTQVAGDYWERNVTLDSADIQDTIIILVPAAAVNYSLRVIDLYAYEIFAVKAKILRARFLSNIRWFARSDTVTVYFTVLNKNGEADSMTVRFYDRDIHHSILKKEIYNDSLVISVSELPIAEYFLKFLLFTKNKKADELVVPIKVSRPFYRDEKAWRLRVSQLEYIATPSEIDELKKADKEARDSLWILFWKQYDPTPNTSNNEKETEYFQRITYADEHFSFGDRGWHSDRGRIYVKYGAPDEVQSKPYELSTRPYEVWYYYKLNLRFIFYDRHGFGEYNLISQEGERI